MSAGQSDSVVDAMVLAARDAGVSERFLMSELPRLAEQAASAESYAKFNARFHLVDGRCAVAGEVRATVKTLCQRCLMPMELALADQFHVVLVASEAEMNELPEAQDSVIANAAHLDLSWLCEEQLLLAMPLVALHARSEECVQRAAPESKTETPSDERQRPFANLRELLNK